MSTTLEIIDSLRTEFILEATNAPKVFKDLAKVEHSIGERYNTVVYRVEKGCGLFISITT